mmetsp:Transcript_9944/g.21485  ORF Transcript_9944/g.21485 Transcript_9944/m.21485 type:complete len:404 (+) Transcript_9944:158-1369(+)|eukprot:CAMPEP_0178473358 /NCGR_PEP_ID=MMETSP0696-20121128/2047_1 /TAXON_ID=265572 /ORGANISM="Extubocellulus spinifer, Strain CCMP396" /LENGTH=403 /DNA_ID=CAMNT_0020100581 /DNA_START=71 /DNA_END=1282 /DNA_ORIENTATION=+
MSSEMIPLLPPNGGGKGHPKDKTTTCTCTGNTCSHLCHRRSYPLYLAGSTAPLLVAAVLAFVAVALLSAIVHQSTGTTSPSLDDLDPANVTFRELAKLMLPEAYDDMCEALPLLQQPHLHPVQVHDTRKVILRTRDLLDVFSPVYPIYQRRENETDDDCDLWLIVRNYTKKLYQKVGEFQDLHYAKHASHAIKHHRRKKVYRLVDAFFQQEEISDSQMHDYLGAPTNGCYLRNESHLFWPSTFRLPAGRDLAMPSLRALGFQQVQHALQYLNETLSYDGLANDTVHETFHNLRKEMRSLTDEYDLFVNSSSMNHIMFPPAASQPNMIPLLKEAHLVLGSLNNDFVGLEIYTQSNDSQPVQEEILHERIRQGWESFRMWIEEVQLEQSLKDLGTLLKTDEPVGQ